MSESLSNQTWPAVFLDRDDTLIANNSLPSTPGVVPGDLCDPARVQLLPGAREACQLLCRAGFRLIVVSNQGVVARGGGTEHDVQRTNARMIELLEEEWEDQEITRALIHAVYHCPFHPNGTVEPYNVEHPWRKPAPGMVLAAAHEHSLDISRSWMVGDSERDAQAGIAAGIDETRCLCIGPKKMYTTMLDAARNILAQN